MKCSNSCCRLLHLEEDQVLSSLIQQGRCWQVADGRQISLWSDSWLDQVPRDPHFLQFTFSPTEYVVALLPDGAWSTPSHLPLAKLTSAKHAQFKSFILRIPSPGRTPLMASSSLRGPGSRLDPEYPFHWASYVWSSILRPNQPCFSWRLLLRKTPTETLVQIKGVHHLASRCYLSRGYLETDVHLLFLYPFSSQLWKWVLGAAGAPWPSNLSSFSPLSLELPIHRL